MRSAAEPRLCSVVRLSEPCGHDLGQPARHSSPCTVLGPRAGSSPKIIFTHPEDDGGAYGERSVRDRRSMFVVSGCAPPSTRARSVVSSSVVTASRRSSRVAPGLVEQLRLKERDQGTLV